MVNLFLTFFISISVNAADKCLPGCAPYRTTYIVVASDKDKQIAETKGMAAAKKMTYEIKVLKINVDDTYFVAAHLVGNPFVNELKQARKLIKTIKKSIPDAYIKQAALACACE